jgi:hypothetical protein
MRTSLRPLSAKVEHASGLFKQPGRLFYIFTLTSVLCLLTTVNIGCAPQQQKNTALQDKPAASFQTNLLQTAFDFATAIPVVPHIKDRSKAQAAVADACFTLEQPQRALGYIEKIGDWRRGAGYADYAFYCVQHGRTNEVPRYLDLAEQVAVIADQDWHRDRIRIKISRTHTLLGQAEQAKRFETGVDAAESGKVARVEATLCTEKMFAAQAQVLDGLIGTGTFDLLKNALYAYAELYNRFYDNTDRRSQIEEKIKASWSPLPVFVRIELLMELAGISLDHKDQSKALELVDAGQKIMDGAVWRAEFRVPLAARLASLRFRCGGTDAARAELREALDLFNGKQSEIINIDKAETLIPVAEAFQIAGDFISALDVYKQAVEAAVENPNSRPHAEDICAICLSMALNNVEPDEALWKRIREIQTNLGDPW